MSEVCKIANPRVLLKFGQCLSLSLSIALYIGALEEREKVKANHYMMEELSSFERRKYLTKGSGLFN